MIYWITAIAVAFIGGYVTGATTWARLDIWMLLKINDVKQWIAKKLRLRNGK